MKDVFRTEEKLKKRLAELEPFRYREVLWMHDFLVEEDMSGQVNPVCPTQFEGWQMMRLGDHWLGRDRYLWLHMDIELPEPWRERDIVARFDFGKTGGGNNSGFESLLYVNGQMYQGVDSNHQEVFLASDLCGQKVSFTFRLWSGLEGGGVPKEQEHKFSHASVGWLDHETDDLYYLGKTVLETMEILLENDGVYYDLKKALDRAFCLLDWSRPGSEAFYASVSRADKVLNESLLSMKKQPFVTVSCIGHTHIDMAWLWRLKHTKEKGARSFSTVMRLMERFPEYIFLQTQPQLYAYMKEEFPELYEQIKARAEEGRWEADGAMWVEADCNLTNGESLTRQILLGSRFFEKEFGWDVQYLWLPDVFGYSWALPQILKKAGIDMFMTTKISWNEYNRMPHDTFWWKGIDGSEVLTHFFTTPEPCARDVWYYTYNGELTPYTVKGVWDSYRDKEWNREMLISYGYGDGGGGVNREMLEMRRRMDMVPGLPAVRTSRAGDYFDRLMKRAKETDSYIHTWDGELYLEFHRGTYTSHAHNKRMNRRMELLYKEAEFLNVFAAVRRNDLSLAKQESLNEGWKLILTNQFHDIIPGSSIHEVYEDSAKDYEMAEQIGRQVEAEAEALLIKPEKDHFVVWNPTAWDMDMLVNIPVTKAGYFTDEAGYVPDIQKSETGYLVSMKQVPAMGAGQLRFNPDETENFCKRSENISFIAGNRKLETPYYVLEFNDAGQLARLYDKTYDREVLASGECANVLQMFEDRPVKYDAWNVDIFYQEKMREITNLVSFQIGKPELLKTDIYLCWKYGDSTITQTIRCYRDSRRIDFITKADYREAHQLLKAAFPVNIRSTYATYDVQYGNVRRPNHWNTDWDVARFESVAHRWVDLSERDYGVSLLNDCKYGHDVKDHRMRITLIKAATHPDYLQDIGQHTFTYALLPHGGDFVEGNVVQEAAALNQTVLVSEGKKEWDFGSLITFDTDHVELDALKKSEDGDCVILRFHEYAGSRKKVHIRSAIKKLRWQEVDLRERPVPDGAAGEGDICLELGAYEIKTLALYV